MCVEGCDVWGWVVAVVWWRRRGRRPWPSHGCSLTGSYFELDVGPSLRTLSMWAVGDFPHPDSRSLHTLRPLILFL